MGLLQDWKEPGIYGRWGINTAEGQAQAVGWGPSGPIFEGEHGFQQAFIDPMTGTYRRDAEGNVQTWTLPITAGQMGGMGGAFVRSPSFRYATGFVKSNLPKLLIASAIGFVAVVLITKFAKSAMK